MPDFYDRGILLYRAKRYALAADEFRRELAQSPGSSRAHSMLAMSLMEAGDLHDAMPAAIEAVRLDPQRAYGYYALSFVHLRAGWTTEAKKDIGVAISIAPADADYLAMLARLEAGTDWFACLDAAQRGLRSSPQHQSCLLWRSKALAALGRDRDAMAALDSAMRVDPENPAVHAVRGRWMLKTGRTADAVRHFTESLRLDPMQPKLLRPLRLARCGQLPLIGPPLRLLVRETRGQIIDFVAVCAVVAIAANLVSFDHLGPRLLQADRICLSAGMVGYVLCAFGPMLDWKVSRYGRAPLRVSEAAMLEARVAYFWTFVLCLSFVYENFLTRTFTAITPSPTADCACLLVMPWLPIFLVRSVGPGGTRPVEAIDPAAGAV